MRNKVIFNLLLVIISLLGVSKCAMAYCPSTPPTPLTIALTNVSVSSTLPIGADIPGSERTLTFSGNCIGTPSTQNVRIIACYYGSGTEVSGMPGVYTTGVAGLGIALMNDKGHKMTTSDCSGGGDSLTVVSNDSSLSFHYSVTLVLVKTSNSIGSGVLSQAQTKFGMGVLNTGAGIGSGGGDNYVAYTGDISYKVVTCSVGNGTIAVDLGKALVADFKNVGYTAQEKDFNIPVSCNDKVNVSMLINGSNNALADSGVISLTKNTGSAAGVGVQILFNDIPIILNKYFEVGSVSSVGGTLNVPFSARYYQLSNDVKGGLVDATATITMAYR